MVLPDSLFTNISGPIFTDSKAPTPVLLLENPYGCDMPEVIVFVVVEVGHLLIYFTFIFHYALIAKIVNPPSKPCLRIPGTGISQAAAQGSHIDIYLK